MSATTATPNCDQREFSLIVTDIRSFGVTLQQALARVGNGSPEDQIVPLDQAAMSVQLHGSKIRRVIIALGTDVSRGLQFIRQIRDLTPLPVMVIGPKDAGLILDAIHAGASDFVEDADPIDEFLAKALSRHRGADASPGKTICVASVRGGSGSSLIAVNLAAAVARRVSRTALCDLDLQGGVCDSLLNLKPKHTILDLERCLDRLDQNSVEQALTPHASGIHLLSSPSDAFDNRFSWGELYQRVLRTMRQMFPVVVTDLPRLTAGIDLQILSSTCDKLVIITQLDFNSVRSAHRVLDQLDRAGMPSNQIHVVWNRYGQPNELSASKGELALNRQQAHIVPDDPKVVNRSINCGTPFVLDAPDSRAAKAVASLADIVLGDLGLASAATLPKSNVMLRPNAVPRGGWNAWVNAAFGRLEQVEFAR